MADPDEAGRRGGVAGQGEGLPQDLPVLGAGRQQDGEGRLLILHPGAADGHAPARHSRRERPPHGQGAAIAGPHLLRHPQDRSEQEPAAAAAVRSGRRLQGPPHHHYQHGTRCPHLPLVSSSS